uniref:Uncharacterized protein n=1 Tax=Sus scrofa TaxID=9823 RepID=A0A8D1X433_PIG
FYFLSINTSFYLQKINLLVIIFPRKNLSEESRPHLQHNCTFPSLIHQGLERLFILKHNYNSDDVFMNYDESMNTQKKVTLKDRPDSRQYSSKNNILELQAVKVNSLRRNNFQYRDIFLVNRRAEPSFTHIPRRTNEHQRGMTSAVTVFFPSHMDSDEFRNGSQEACRAQRRGLFPESSWEKPTLSSRKLVSQSGQRSSERTQGPRLGSNTALLWLRRNENLQAKMYRPAGSLVLGPLGLALARFLLSTHTLSSPPFCPLSLLS